MSAVKVPTDLLSSVCVCTLSKDKDHFTRFILNNSGKFSDDKELAQKHESQKIAYWSPGVDVFMTTAKGGVGWLSNSTVIIADISLVLEKVT